MNMISLQHIIKCSGVYDVVYTGINDVPKENEKDLNVKVVLLEVQGCNIRHTVVYAFICFHMNIWIGCVKEEKDIYATDFELHFAAVKNLLFNPIIMCNYTAHISHLLRH